ncbi:MAG: DUF3467 domain-containing protein [Candidatus Marinimicrobia bacterium]|nr:DUF3467 domain-containing protein [Candidatus Neomarinimicrobiota bacterium]
MENEKSIKELKIEIPQDISEGKYSNFTVISHSPAEFVIDFARIMPGQNKAVVKSRIILTPIHAKTLLMTLMDNIKKFEDKFGEIKIPERELNIPFTPKEDLPN